MADKLMYIPNDEKQNYPFSRLKLMIEMFEHSINQPIKIHKVPKVVNPTNTNVTEVYNLLFYHHILISKWNYDVNKNKGKNLNL